ncbi:WecB/TagA/CpsF family glycosyltransferase [Shewanella fidelis]|uniref:WecB/TagA/CpsF family glycosyltransferase n=1 Tax=Shewanella fidelis TaxID=173509 RepID=UPI000490B33D|nr:WecB/TagA/CpsF family glycosyltransferase [Shewanella fidelis]
MKNDHAKLPPFPISIRCFDVFCGSALLMLTSPLFLYAYLASRFSSNKTFEVVYIKGMTKQTVELIEFGYNGLFKKLPILFNLIRGELSLVGKSIEFTLDANQVISDDKIQNIKPGLMSIEQLNALVGLEFENSTDTLIKAHSSFAGYIAAVIRCLVLKTTFALLFKAAPKTSPHISLFGITLSNWSMQQLLDEMLQQCSEPQADMQQYSFVNADCLNISTDNQAYRQSLQQSQHIFADGIGLRLACLSKGQALRANLNGTDMFPRLCQLAAKQNLSIFMLGGAQGVAQTAAEKMQARYPSLTIAGCHHGYFNRLTQDQENQQVIQAINDSNADILLVAMGAPNQELWLKQNRAQLHCSIGIGVGGLFDFYSERIKRAPLWLRQMGLEWTYRLLQEPKRMWKRYIIGNPLFLYRVWRENRELKKRVGSIISSSKAMQVSNSSLSDKQLTKQLQAKLGKAQRHDAKLPKFDHKHASTRRARFDFAMRCNKVAKRSLDLIGALTLLLLLMPIFIITALAIKLSSPGPALYSQTRSGLYNRPFTMWKFRSMHIDADKILAELDQSNEMQGGVLFKMKSDPRVTFIGRLIRKTSIDELPQLWNVLKGDMSLVGPRPPLNSEVEQYSIHQRNRLTVKPGLTCIWQVSGRSTIPFEQQVELDIEYIHTQSLMADVWLLLKTIPAVIFARGAY